MVWTFASLRSTNESRRLSPELTSEFNHTVRTSGVDCRPDCDRFQHVSGSAIRAELRDRRVAAGGALPAASALFTPRECRHWPRIGLIPDAMESDDHETDCTSSHASFPSPWRIACSATTRRASTRTTGSTRGTSSSNGRVARRPSCRATPNISAPTSSNASPPTSGSSPTSPSATTTSTWKPRAPEVSS